MFSKKKLKAEITLMDETYHPEKTLTIEDLPISVNIEYVGNPSMPKAKIRIYGVSKEIMDEITTIQLFEVFVKNRRIRISADEGDGYQVLFDGGIMNAVPMYNTAPNVFIQIESSLFLYQNFENLPPFNVPDTGMSIYSAISNCCKPFGIQVENYMTTTGMAKGGQYDGGLRDRLWALERSCGSCRVTYVSNNIVRLFDKENPTVTAEYELTPDNYIGYPNFNSCGIELTLDKLLPIECGDAFTISGSQVGFANTSWQVFKKQYNLESYMNGKWQMKLWGIYYVKK